jgi:hypothetical protein
MNDTSRLIASQLAGAAVVAVAVVWGAHHIAGAQRVASDVPTAEACGGSLQSAATPAPAAAATVGRVATASSPVDPVLFSRQWKANYAKVADEKCWGPHSARYSALPGHLDLELQVSARGEVREVALMGFTNPGDHPDRGLAEQVHACVSAILKRSRFPSHPTDYVVRGRVNRPNPSSPASVATVGAESLSGRERRAKQEAEARPRGVEDSRGGPR